MKYRLACSAALLFAASLPLQLNASTFDFNFAGPGVSGTVQLTYGTATDAKYPQAYEITGVSGWFSDTNNGLNIVNAPIGALQPIVHSTPDATNLLAPHDFSRFAVASGLGPQSGGFLTFDNLYWPTGSVQTASDYPGAGGIFDIYGLMFTIGNGTVVDVWSNGGSNHVDYGVGVATATNALDYVGGGVSVTPEPEPFALLGLGLSALLIWRGRRASGQNSL